MKKISFVLLAFIFLTGNLVAQKTKNKKVSYSYTVYPWVKYDKNIKSYKIETNYQHEFLKGSLDSKYDTTTHITTYSFKEIDMLQFMQVKGLELSQTEGLRIVMNFRSTGDADHVIVSYEKKTDELVNAESPLALIGKMKEKLLFAKVDVFENETLIATKTFEWKRDYKTEYINYYKNKTGKKPYENYDTDKMSFADKNANALFLIGYNIGFAENAIKKFVNEYIGFSEKTMEIKIYTAKGKKMDYSLLNKTQEKAVNAIKSGNNEELKQCVTTWLELLKKADYSNKKAQYNADVSAMILQNCLYACFVTEDFEMYKTIIPQFLDNKDKMKKSNQKSLNKIGGWVEWLEKNRIANAHRF